MSQTGSCCQQAPRPQQHLSQLMSGLCQVCRGDLWKRAIFQRHLADCSLFGHFPFEILGLAFPLKAGVHGDPNWPLC